MKAAVKTREFKRDLDYDWEDYFPSDKTLVSEAGMLHRALEGADDSSRFAALLRPATDVGVTLVVSVCTVRKDAVGRPIRTMSFLRAENSDEERLLASFFAEILRKKDAETLYDPKSGVAKAVESLYQTKKPDEFLAFCKSLKPDDGKGVAPENRCAFSRDNATERNSLADALPAAITGNSSFLFAITDRRWTDIRASLGSMFDRKTIRIFSKATTGKEPIPEPPQKYGRAATIGGVVVLSILFVAAIDGSCLRRNDDDEPVASTNSLVRAVESRAIETNAQASGGGGEAVAPTNRIGRAVDGGVVATNAPARGGIGSTNAVPTEGRSIEPVRETRPGGISSNAAPASSETPAAVTNNPAESPAIRIGEAK